MSDDFKTAKTALAKLHQDMEAINRLAKPSYLSVIEQMERTLEPIRRQQLEISRALEMSGTMARIQEIASANQHWQELIKQTATSRIAESLAEIETVQTPLRYGLTPCMRLRIASESQTTIRPFFGTVGSIRHKTLDFDNPLT